MRGKVHIFWEGHKFLQNLHKDLSYVAMVKSTVEISQNFVAFSEYMNFDWCQMGQTSFYKVGPTVCAISILVMGSIIGQFTLQN